MRRWIWIAIILVIGAAAIVMLGDVRQLVDRLGGFRWWALGAALALALANYAIRFARWALYLRHQAVRIPLRTSALVFGAGLSLSITPGKVGELVKSYRQLPAIVYHFQTKFRDEPRARGGLIRVREFVMKDSYSLDADEAGSDKQYQAHHRAYCNIFGRCGLPVIAVGADVGMMGGTGAHEYMAPCEAGENQVALCASCDYAANVEVAVSVPSAPDFPPTLDAPQEVETPGVTTIDALAAYLSIDPRATAKNRSNEY